MQPSVLIKTLLPILVLVFAIPSRAQGNEALNLRGTISSSGKPVADAFVLLRDIESASPEFVSKNWEMHTESDGRFSFRVPPGRYDLLVSSNGSLPFSQRIRMEKKDSVLKIELHPDGNARIRTIDQF